MLKYFLNKGVFNTLENCLKLVHRHIRLVKHDTSLGNQVQTPLKKLVRARAV